MSKAGLALAVVFLAVFALTALGEYEGSWGGFLLFVLAQPASWIALWVGSFVPGAFVPLAALLGALWWYAVGALVECVVRRITRRSRQ